MERVTAARVLTTCCRASRFCDFKDNKRYIRKLCYKSSMIDSCLLTTGMDGSKVHSEPFILAAATATTTRRGGSPLEAGTRRQKKDDMRMKTDDGRGSDGEDGEGGHRTNNKIPDQSNKRKPSTPRPTHFLAVRVKNPQIQETIDKLQSEIIKRNALLEPCMVSPILAHMTLFVMHLATVDEVKAAAELLTGPASSSSSSPATPSHLLHAAVRATAPLPVTFQGLGTFTSKVLFASLVEGEAKEKLHMLSSLAYQAYEEGNITVQPFNFKPHLTICKTSKFWSSRRRKGGRAGAGKKNKKWKRGKPPQITRDAYEGWENMLFGSHVLSGIELLAMREKDDDGYYRQIAYLAFGEKGKEGGGGE